MKNLAKIKSRLGAALIKLGAKLYFDSEKKRDLFKHSVNNETVIGSYAESGGYIHGQFNPMNDYDTQSVIISLKQGHFCKEITPSSKSNSYCDEDWIR